MAAPPLPESSLYTLAAPQDEPVQPARTPSPPNTGLPSARPLPPEAPTPHLTPPTALVMARKWVDEHRDKGTRSSYQREERKFQKFCVNRKLSALPADAATVVLYIAHLIKHKYARGTIGVSIAAIAYAHTSMGFVDPTEDPLVARAKKVIVKKTRPPKHKLPLTRQHVVEIASSLLNVAPKDRRDILAILIGLGGMVRSDNLSNLRHDDVKLCKLGETWCIAAYLEKSKTDQGRIGHTVLIAQSSEPLCCPVNWFRLYQETRNPASDFFFHQMDGTDQLSAKTFNHIVKDRLEAIGVDPTEYGSHSMRRGGATAAAAQGICERLIRKHGTWAPGSRVVQMYIDDALMHVLETSQAILSADTPSLAFLNELNEQTEGKLGCY